jgi:uncharacterized protein (DUF427 family)
MQGHHFRIGDMVETTRLTPANGWEVIDAKGHNSHRELQLKNQATKEVAWLYEAHCFASVKLKLENARNQQRKAKERADHILSKPKRRR